MKRKHVIIALVMVISTMSLYAKTVELNVSVSNPYLLSDQRQSVFLKVGLTGFELAAYQERAATNVSIVLDRSGSMEGEKIARAKEAALLAVEMLDSRDIVSIVTYSDTVTVLVPATRVSDKRYLKRKIESVFADGSTALFAGVSKGADEVSKFFERNRVNRVILLSDGLANVGPDSPMALGHLGDSLKKTGISVTTIGLGLGYNEDLMVKLARKSDGNHAFVENYNDLVRIFQYEFDDILSVVAQDVEIEITCSDGVIPLRILGRDAEIIGNRVFTSISQLYSRQEKYLLLELEILPNRAGVELDIASVNVNYDNMQTRNVDRLSGSTNVVFTTSAKTVKEKKDKDTLVEAVKQIAVETAEEAILLRDKGLVDEAQDLLLSNSEYLLKEAEELDSEDLERMGAVSGAEASVIEDDSAWNSTRKKMKAESYETQNQQSY